MGKTIIFGLLLLLAPSLWSQEWLPVPEDLQEAAMFYDYGYHDMQVINDELIILAGGAQIMHFWGDVYTSEDLIHHWFKIREGEIESIRQPIDTFGLSTFSPRIIRPFQDQYLVGGLFGYASDPDSVGWAVFKGDNIEWELFENSWVDDEINDIAVRDSSFVMVGKMQLKYGPELNHGGIIHWNGTSWDDFGGGNCDWPSCTLKGVITLPDQTVIYGGCFPVFCDYTTGETFNNGFISVKTENGWSSIGSGTNNAPKRHSLDSATGVYYLMGVLSTADGMEIPGIVGYDGNDFVPLPGLESIDGSIYSLERYRGQLFITGRFDQINGESGYGSLARFDGVNWQQVGEGTGQSEINFRLLKAFEDNLWITGPANVYVDGEIWSERVGILHMEQEDITWGKLPDVPDVWQAIEEKDQKTYGLHLFPNPTDGPLNVKFNLPVSGELIITDLSGKQVHHEILKEVEEIKLDMRPYSSGTFLVNYVKMGVIQESVRVVVE